MKINKRIIFASVLTAGSVVATVSAQGSLSKEITVDKEIVPQEREAQRLPLLPQTIRPDIKTYKLNWSARAVEVSPASEVRVLPPAAWNDAIAPQPYRGYVSAGYMPALQFGVSAGYRLVDNGRTQANVALQYDGTNYKGSPRLFNGMKPEYRYNYQTFRLGADISHKFGDNRTLGAGVSYMHLSYNNPIWYTQQVVQDYQDGGFNNISGELASDEYSFTQKADRIDGNINWNHALDAFSYGLNFRTGYFGYGKSPSNLGGFKGAGNVYFGFDADFRLKLGDKSSVGVVASYELVNYRKLSRAATPWINDDVYGFSYTSFNKGKNGVVDATAYFRTDADTYSMLLGVHLSSRSGDDKGTLVYPEVRLAWMPTQQFSAYVRAGGGNVRLNTLGRLWDADPYACSFQQVSPSYEKWRGDGGINIGPFEGMTVELWGGYTRWGRLALPTRPIAMTYADVNSVNFDLGYTGLYGSGRFTSIHYGAAVGYKYGSVVAVRLSYEGAPDGEDKGYSQWLDRAKCQFKASVSVNPIKNLGIKLEYGISNGRRMYMQPEPNYTKTDEHVSVSLGTAASLDLGAYYNIDERFTVWADAENILNRRWQLCYGVMNPGLTGLVGVTYKF